MTARESAWNMLNRINEEGILCHKALRSLEADGLSPVDRALATRLVHGTLERSITIDRVISHKTGKPVGKLKPRLRNLMRMSVYQLLFLSQIPASAVCNEAVKLAKKGGYAGLSGFVNGVLRGLSREVTEAGSGEAYIHLLAASMQAQEAKSFLYAMPPAFIDYYETNYPSEAEEMFQAFLSEGGISIRLNRSRGTMEELKASLDKASIAYRDGLLSNTLYIEKAGNLSTTEGFLRGLFSIQDQSSALAGNILPLRAGMKVLDLCAAPGGKSIHVADELSALGGGSVLARDIAAGKLPRIREHIALLSLDNITVEAGDASVYDQSLSEQFDLVLADLPCSGLGVIGRKPDIKTKTTLSDIRTLSELQRLILTSAVRYVKAGGYLCYSTCTVTVEENDRNCDYIESLGFSREDFSEKVPASLRKRYQNGRLQLFPQDGTDGFFAALFRKKE